MIPYALPIATWLNTVLWTYLWDVNPGLGGYVFMAGFSAGCATLMTAWVWVEEAKRPHARSWMRKIQRSRYPQHTQRRPHRPTAYGCVKWTGDRHPLDLGVCPTCGPPR